MLRSALALATLLALAPLGRAAADAPPASDAKAWTPAATGAGTGEKAKPAAKPKKARVKASAPKAGPASAHEAPAGETPAEKPAAKEPSQHGAAPATSGGQAAENPCVPVKPCPID